MQSVLFAVFYPKCIELMLLFYYEIHTPLQYLLTNFDSNEFSINY